LKWEEVLRVALKILANQKRYVSFKEWTWGGGSALAYRYGHRDSEDVDIFFWNAQLLLFFSPRVNQDLEEVALRYTEMSHFIKLWIREDAQIDFILAPSLTDLPFTVEEVMGFKVQVETPWEVAAKKLLYRSSDLKVRDVIDLVAVLRRKEDREALLRNAKVFRPKIEELRERLAFLKREWDRAVEKLTLYDESLRSPSLIEELEELLLAPRL